jgi:hypothetical protein
MNALFTLPGYIEHCFVELVIPWHYHKGGRYNVASQIAEDGFDTLLYIPSGAAHYCTFSIVEGGPDVEEPQIRIS